MPVKVLMFGWELPPFNSGGLGTACHGLTQALADAGVEITFVLPKELPIHADHMRIIFAALPDFDWVRYSAYTSTLHSLGPTPLADLPPDLVSMVFNYAQKAGHIAAQVQHDLVHAHDWLCAPAGSVASARSGQPLVSHIHATEFDRTGGSGLNPSIYAIERRTMSRSAKIIAVSNFTKNLLTRHYGADTDKVAVVHNGVDSDDFSHPAPGVLGPLRSAGYKIVTYIGRLTVQKGVDYFITAAHLALQHDPKLVFLIIGSGDLENQLIRQVASLGISDHVLFGGFLRGHLLKSVYQSSDLFVMPSVSEPFGLTALEAIASGTPAIISLQSGASEVIRHALKVNFWDIQEMANQILAVTSSPALHRTLKSEGLADVRQSTWSSAAAKTISIYHQILNSKT